MQLGAHETGDNSVGYRSQVRRLKRYVVTIDFPGKRLFLKRYETAPADLDTYDRSGMRIETGPTGFRVLSVAAGTPAAEAGLHPGDVIVAIDGRPASSISLPVLCDELGQRFPGAARCRISIEPNRARLGRVVREFCSM
jgi:predicted metalloprotease with PDZ domain